MWDYEKLEKKFEGSSFIETFLILRVLICNGFVFGRFSGLDEFDKFDGIDGFDVVDGLDRIDWVDWFNRVGRVWIVFGSVEF